MHPELLAVFVAVVAFFFLKNPLAVFKFLFGVAGPIEFPLSVLAGDDRIVVAVVIIIILAVIDRRVRGG